MLHDAPLLVSTTSIAECCSAQVAASVSTIGAPGTAKFASHDVAHEGQQITAILNMLSESLVLERTAEHAACCSEQLLPPALVDTSMLHRTCAENSLLFLLKTVILFYVLFWGCT